MKQDINCEVVKDLLPNYIEKLTSSKTNEILEQHFKECPSCARERDELLSEVHADTIPDMLDMKKYLSKTKQMYLLKGIFSAILGVGLITSLIVDIAINHKLTWSFIVAIAIAYVGAGLLTAQLSSSSKMVKVIAVLSVLLIPLLYGIEYIVNSNYAARPFNWFFSYELPIAIIWLVILWVVIIIKHTARLSIWNFIGITLLLASAGSLLNNSIALKMSIWKVLTIRYNWINAVIYIACAFCCFLIGYIRKNKEMK